MAESLLTFSTTNLLTRPLGAPRVRRHIYHVRPDGGRDPENRSWQTAFRIESCDLRYHRGRLYLHNNGRWPSDKVLIPIEAICASSVCEVFALDNGNYHLLCGCSGHHIGSLLELVRTEQFARVTVLRVLCGHIVWSTIRCVFAGGEFIWKAQGVVFRVNGLK